MCVYIYTQRMEYHSAIQNNWNIAIWGKMDGPKVYHTEWGKPDKEV